MSPHGRRHSWLPALAAYTALTLLALGPALRPGYVLSLDMVFGPRFNFGPAHGLYAVNLPIQALLWSVSRILPVWLLQKVILISILLCSAGSMYIMLAALPRSPRFMGGTLYAFNPFVFSRLIAGHWQFLLAYAFAPLVAKLVFETFANPSARSGAAMGAAIAALVLVSLHFLFIWLLPLAALIATFSMNSPHKRLAAKAIIAAAATFLAISSFWLYAYFQSSLVPAPFAQRDYAMFASRADPFMGATLNVAALNGFWQKQVPQVSSVLPGWHWLYLALLGLVVFGLAAPKVNKSQRLALVCLAATGIVAIILALGTATPLTKPIYLFLYDKAPFFKGYREPNKFLALAALAYAFVAAVGYDHAARRLSGARAATIALNTLMVIFVAAYISPLFWGLGGQLHSTSYPRAWSDVDRILSRDGRPRVLILPWEQYMTFKFTHTDRVLSNPALVFFDATMITPDETGAVADAQGTAGAKELVAKALRPPYSLRAFNTFLYDAKVEYVLLLKEDEYKRYLPLLKAASLRVNYGSPELTLLKVKTENCLEFSLAGN